MATSTLLSRALLALRAGLTHSGDRDLYKVFGYKTQIVFNDYYIKYLRQDVARRIIEAPASGTWRNPPIVTGGDAFDAAWKTLVEERKIWNALERVDKAAGIGQFAILLFGFNNGSLGAQIAPGVSKELLYTRVYTESSVTIETLESNINDERYGLPKEYVLEVVDPTKIVRGSPSHVRHDPNNNLKVHYSRILHVAEGCLENDILGTPRLESVYNLLDDLLKVAGGSAETFWMVSNRGMQADIDKEMEMNPEDAEALKDEIDEYVHGLSRFIKTRGVKINPLGREVVDPRGAFNVIMSLISGATGIPQRILLGSEAGQLASDQDRANWADRISERQTEFAEPIILRPFIGSLVTVGVLPEPKDLQINWREPSSLTPLEESQMMAQKGRAISNISKQKTSGMQIVTREEAREMIGLPAVPLIGTLAPESDPTKPIEEEEDEDSEDEGEDKKKEESKSKESE